MVACACILRCKREHGVLELLATSHSRPQVVLMKFHDQNLDNGHAWI